MLWVSTCTTLPSSGVGVGEVPINTNVIQRFYDNSESRGQDETRSLKKVFLSNRSVTCNDGSQAG